MGRRSTIAWWRWRSLENRFLNRSRQSSHPISDTRPADLRHARAFRIRYHALLAGLATLVAACGAVAQPFPSQPIRLIVGFTPGTGIDIIARTVQPKLQERI